MPTAKKKPAAIGVKKNPNLIELIKTKWPKKSNKPHTDHAALWGKIGFTLGLVSVGTWLMPLLGIIVSVTGLVFSIIGLKVEKSRWFAVSGLTLSIVFLNLSFLYGFYAVLLSMFGSYGI